jgi:hypothetical protein
MDSNLMVQEAKRLIDGLQYSIYAGNNTNDDELQFK